jgi:hypothetical protein
MSTFLGSQHKAFASALVIAVIAGFGGQATAAGVISNVVEMNGDNEATDTIAAQWSGQMFSVSVDNEPVPGATIGSSFTVGQFGDLAPTFVDRNHRYTNTDVAGEVFPIPSYLVGGDYIMSGNDNRDNATYQLDVTVSSPVRAYMLIDNRLGKVDAADNATPPTFAPDKMQWILDGGWMAVTTGANRAADITKPDEVGIDEGADGTINQWYSIYAKDFPAGTFNLYQADNAGRNMYGVVVVPEPSSFVLLAGSALVLLSRRRRAA